MNRYTLVGLGLAGDPVPPLNITMGGLAGIGHEDVHIIINDSAGGADGVGTMGNIGMIMGLGGVFFCAFTSAATRGKEKERVDDKYPIASSSSSRTTASPTCGKECESTAWSEDHRFWCSAKDADDETTAAPASASTVNAGEPSQMPQHQHAANAGEPDRRGKKGIVKEIGMAGTEQSGASTSRARSPRKARGFTLFNLQRSSLGQVVPSQSRARSELTLYGSSDGWEFDASEGGRTCFETVTRVMSVGSSTGRPDLMIPPYVPNSTQFRTRTIYF
ncbi:hypothetical protein C8R41DRAFT_915997 [Lentinula lateritia]|uniref:Uncharacterized protein n=1 Tax=Lentinula lateritia TaxID=40482 RepID=A0ABQ8VR71_9AGAR|nr:hypothetical protein C8R41DRAFT_915997 [Lentinula lateritia]